MDEADTDGLIAEIRLIEHLADNIREGNYLDQRLYLLQHIGRLEPLIAAPSPASADGLHADTAKLIEEFSIALAAKLLGTQHKYGYTNGWLTDEWQDECRRSLMAHIMKGDPKHPLMLGYDTPLIDWARP